MPEPISAGPIHVHAYAQPLTVRAGENVQIMVSAIGTSRVDAQLVRVIHGDAHPDGPGYVEEEIAHPENGVLAVRHQPVRKGNYLRIDDPQSCLCPDGALIFWAFIYPTMPAGGRQTLIAWRNGAVCNGKSCSPSFVIDDAGYLAFDPADDGEGAVRSSARLLPHIWYLVALSLDTVSGRVEIHQRAAVGRYNACWSRIVPVDYDAVTVGSSEGIEWGGSDGLLIGGHDLGEGDGVGECYNGKIDRFGLLAETVTEGRLEELMAGTYPEPATSISFWDTTVGYTESGIGDVVRDLGPHAMHAHGVNRPVRGQTGWNWDGRSESFVHTPEQYGGIEFHDDALADCDWNPSVELTLPADLRSGVYALRLSADGETRQVIERAVFFVRPPEPKAKLALLLPTATYLSYANGPRSMEGDVGQAIMGRAGVLSWRDIEAAENGYEFGLSTYDTHRNGAGVCYSSARRPIFTMQPDYRNPGVAAPWGLAADLSIIAWLEHCGYDYDVITDEVLEAEGVAALAPYRVVLNGSHCEYYSENMLDATEDYLEGGGRLLYLSGNGYYWVVAFRPDEPWIMEVRRREGGSRAWEGRPGEGHLATNGRPGGLWRHRNRAPQKLVGTGFAAEGMDLSFAYRKLDGSRDERGAWIFKGVEGDRFGDAGLIHGGAVGLEIDRYDPALGSPPNALCLATSELLTSNWLLVPEDVMFNYPGLGGHQNPQVRCDMLGFATRNGGAVFSPSSIAWAGALPVNGFDNDVSRIMRNVVDRFLEDEAPFA